MVYWCMSGVGGVAVSSTKELRRGDDYLLLLANGVFFITFLHHDQLDAGIRIPRHTLIGYISLFSKDSKLFLEKLC